MALSRSRDLMLEQLTYEMVPHGRDADASSMGYRNACSRFITDVRQQIKTIR